MSALFFLPAFLVDCAAGVCVWGGAVCTQVTCQSYDNESIPSCFGSYFGQEKSRILVELEFGATGIKRNIPSPF